MILCCGEALIDMLPRESTGGEDVFAPYPGGAVFNTAIAAGRLGAPTGFFSGISNDLFGEMLFKSLIGSDVFTSYTVRSGRPTTLAFVTLSDGQARYAFYDENTAGRMLTEADLPELGADVECLFFGGISLVVDPCGSTYAALMQREAADRVTMIDPNIRPGFITDETTYRARIEGMIAAADIVKLSDEDMDWLYGPGGADTNVSRVLAAGPKVVCITEGAKGATAHTERGATFIAASRVDVVDTVGAGDTFNAGFLVGLHEAGALRKGAIGELSEDVLANALDLGVRAAAKTVARAGANPPHRGEL